MPSTNIKRSIWADKVVLITGASGVMGQALASYLKDQGFSSLISVSTKDANFGDLNQTDELMRRIKPDLIFHLAARVAGIMGNMHNRSGAFLDNIRINTNVIDAAQRNGVSKIVAMGTTAIYSDIVKLPMSEDDLWLGAPHGSEAPYGHAKRAMLAQLEAYREEYGLKFAYSISTNLFGPGDKFDEQTGHVIPSLISKFHRAVMTGGPIEVWGTGAPTRDFLYSKDAAAALLLMAEIGDGPINMATGNPISIHKCVTTIASVVGYKGEIIWDATKPNGQMLRNYDISRLTKLGFKPKYSFEESIQQTFSWYSENVAKARR